MRRRPEKGFAFYLEEASFVTLGLCYEKTAALQRRCVQLDREEAVGVLRLFALFCVENSRKACTATAQDLDEKVADAVAKLKAKGFVSPYLKAFVVARINPLRWIQGEPPPLEEVLKTMRDRAAKFNADKIKQEDLASGGGAPDDSD